MLAFDCRLHYIEGFESHKAVCESILRANNDGSARGVVLAVPDSDLFYCQYDFRWQPDDISELKMLQPITYLLHAWQSLEVTHTLRTVLCPDKAVEALIRHRSIGQSNRWRTKRASIDADPPAYPSDKHKSLRRVGIFNRLFGRKDWVDSLESVFSRSFTDELVDPTSLPGNQADLLTNLLVRAVSSGTKPSGASQRESARCFHLYVLTACVNPLAKLISGRVSGLFRASPDADETQSLKCLASALHIFESRSRMKEWAKLSAVIFAPLSDETIEIVRAYHSLLVDSQNWRFLNADVCGYLRIIVFSSSKHRDTVKSIAARGETDLSLFAEYQLAVWEASVGNMEAAIGRFESVSLQATRFVDARSLMLGFESLVSIALVACDGEMWEKAKWALGQISDGKFDSCQSVVPRFRAACMNEQLCKGLYSMAVDGKGAVAQAHFQRGLSIGQESPGEMYSPSVVIATARILQKLSILSTLDKDSISAEAYLKQTIDTLASIAFFKFQHESSAVSLVPNFVLAEVCSSALDEINGANGIAFNEYVRDTMLKNFIFLSESAEFRMQIETILDLQRMDFAGAKKQSECTAVFHYEYLRESLSSMLEAKC